MSPLMIRSFSNTMMVISTTITISDRHYQHVLIELSSVVVVVLYCYQIACGCRGIITTTSDRHYQDLYAHRAGRGAE